MRLPGFHNSDPVEVGKRAFKGFSGDDMSTYAAALAYRAIFALFPFVIFLIALLGFLQLSQFFDWLLEQTQTVMPQDAYQRFADVINQVRNNQQGGLLSFGAVLALWAASGGVRALMNALNKAYDVDESRPMWKLYALSVAYTLGLAVLIIGAVALMVLGPQPIEWLANQAGMGSLFVTLWTWLRIPVAIVLLIFTAALIYYAGPNVNQPFTFITPGAVIAVIIWVLASLGFSIYVSNFGSYNATYGSLGSVIVVLLFMYISAAVLLLGAEINAELLKSEHGHPEPNA